MYVPVLVTPPAETPVDLDQAKLHLHVDGDDENDLITAYIEAYTAHLDGYTGILGRCLVTQTWRQDFDDWARTLRLPLIAASITSVKVRDSAGALTTVTATDYSLLRDARGSFVRFKDAYAYPYDLAETQGILVEFTAGYGAAASVPPPLKAAILLGVGDLYANREAKVEGLIENRAVNALVAPYRLVGV